MQEHDGEVEVLDDDVEFGGHVVAEGPCAVAVGRSWGAADQVHDDFCREPEGCWEMY